MSGPPCFCLAFLIILTKAASRFNKLTINTDVNYAQNECNWSKYCNYYSFFVKLENELFSVIKKKLPKYEDIKIKNPSISLHYGENIHATSIFFRYGYFRTTFKTPIKI